MVRAEGPVAAPQGPHVGRRRRRLHAPLDLNPLVGRIIGIAAVLTFTPIVYVVAWILMSADAETDVAPVPPLLRDRGRPRLRPARVGAAALGSRPCDGARTGRAG